VLRPLLLSAATLALLISAPTRPARGAEADPGEIIDARPAAPAPSSETAGPRSVIGPQDLLDIKVFQLDTFNQTQRVSEDGSITLPLLGRLAVAGLSREEVERKIAGLLSQWVNDPQVSVFVRENESRKISVTGAVQKPGSYEMLGVRTLIEMIAVAGGATRDAGPTIVVLRRTASGPPQRIELRLDTLLRAEDASENIPLQPGDIVYLPPEEIFKVYVNGAVRRPGPVEVKASEPISVLQAITAAEGTSERASERRVQVIRHGENGEKTILVVDLRRVRQGRAEDIVLEKNDIVFVPESFF